MNTRPSRMDLKGNQQSAAQPEQTEEEKNTDAALQKAPQRRRTLL